MFGRSVTLFQLLGFKVQVDMSWIFLALLVTWSLAEGFFPAYYLGLPTATYWGMGLIGTLGLFGSLIFHELAHSLVARRFGIPITGITLFVFGGVAHMDEEPPSPKAEFLMAIAGPLSSFALSATSYLLFKAGYRYGLPLSGLGLLGYLAMVNSLLAAFNLVPAFPLDGGRMFRAIVWHWKRDLRAATKLASSLGSWFGLTLLLLGLFHIVTGNFVMGIWWSLMGLFLRGAAGASYYQLVARRTLKGEPIKRFMTANPVTVSTDLSIKAFIDDYVYRYLHDIYPVMKNSQLVGCVETKQIIGLPRDDWGRRTIGDLMKPCSEDNTVGADIDAVTALSIMHRTGNSRLLVVEGHQLVGIIALKDLMKFLSLKLDLEGIQR